MGGLRIGIDVGGTFTHGVVLRPPGEVLLKARTPTTHGGEHGVADGVRTVLGELLGGLDNLKLPRADVELVAHSTTQATNALLEGDVAPVTRIAIVPPGEMAACRSALGGARLDIGGGHQLEMQTHFVSWESAGTADALPQVGGGMPVAVIQPLAGRQELREAQVAAACHAAGLPVVCASEITQVLGLAARARTAAVNASMLPTMLRTADFTERAVGELLRGVPLQVVRSDGGAMSLGEMRRQPILSLLSGPAAGASAALDLSGLSEVIFIEAGGTSTDITLIKEGRVRHRYATVGGQRLMVPALDLRTVALGGGSMLRADGSRFGPRSAHIAGLPYLFQALDAGLSVVGRDRWRDADHGTEYLCAVLEDDSRAALTLTDMWLAFPDERNAFLYADELGIDVHPSIFGILQQVFASQGMPSLAEVLQETYRPLRESIRELAASHGADLRDFSLIGGGGAAPVLAGASQIMEHGGLEVIPHHEVISAIGAALAVTCVSLSRSVAEPSAGDIGALTAEVEDRLRGQGAQRVSTDYEFDPHRQVLTVTGRGARAYEQNVQPASEDQLRLSSTGMVGDDATVVWEGDGVRLWLAARSVVRGRGGHRRVRGRLALAVDGCGRSLWFGLLSEYFAAGAHERDRVLDQIIEQRTQYTDGGPALPGLALIADGRFIPLDQLGSRTLIDEVLRWENLPAAAPGCFVIRD